AADDWSKRSSSSGWCSCGWPWHAKFQTPFGEPARLDEESIEAAQEFLWGVLGGAGSCTTQAFEEVLGYVDRSPSDRHTVIYVGDGGGTCDGQREQPYLEAMVETVTTKNAGRADIHTIGVLMGGGRRFHEDLLLELARRNNGRYVRSN
ncbi:MAG: hypothetical protein AAF517_27415, partial [Planctomycetota bacterium]